MWKIASIPIIALGLCLLMASNAFADIDGKVKSITTISKFGKSVDWSKRDDTILSAAIQKEKTDFL